MKLEARSTIGAQSLSAMREVSRKGKRCRLRYSLILQLSDDRGAKRGRSVGPPLLIIPAKMRSLPTRVLLTDITFTLRSPSHNQSDSIKAEEEVKDQFLLHLNPDKQQYVNFCLTLPTINITYCKTDILFTMRTPFPRSTPSACSLTPVPGTKYL